VLGDKTATLATKGIIKGSVCVVSTVSRAEPGCELSRLPDRESGRRALVCICVGDT
jgi:hypothetical protein